MAKPTSAPPAVPPPARSLSIDLTPSPDAREGLAFRHDAAGLVVSDQATHRHALEFIRAGKQLKRKIEEHWSRITRSVDDLKRNLLDLKRQDLDPVESAIADAERAALTYSQAEDRRVRDENDRLRRESEERARHDRETLLADQEAAALRIERDSPNLSNRELIFVEAIAAHQVGVGQPFATAAAMRAGYKGPEAASQRLLATEKIMDAIADKRKAVEIRRQAAATKEQPLEVIEQKPVEKQTARVAGTRTTVNYSAEVYDADKLLDAVIAGTAPREAVMPDQVYLNLQARQLHEKLELAYPGVKIIRKDGIAG